MHRAIREAPVGQPHHVAEGTFLSALMPLRNRITAMGAAIVVLLVAGVWIALTHASAQPTATGRKSAAPAPATSSPAAAPLRVTSVSPARRSTGVSGVAAIALNFSSPLAATSPLPTIRPRIRGTWHGRGTSRLRFIPAASFHQHTRVTVRIPGGTLGIRSSAGGLLPGTLTFRYRVGSYQTARLDQLLAGLGYLPLTWTPAAGAHDPAASDARGQLAAAYSPPAGQYTWDAGYPSTLHQFWRGGSTAGLIFKGAVMAFEANHGLVMDGVAGPQVWNAVLQAEATHQVNPHGYTYAIASEDNPEMLTIWHNGQLVLHTATNTGIPASPTTIGTSPVYLRFYFQIMKGRNPDGSKYADPVHYVAYFRSGEAVHYFPRPAYGYPQSLGCVELPWDQAKTAWPYMTYGSLVTVQRGALTPSTSPTDPTT
jgi:hypothetical protein